MYILQYTIYNIIKHFPIGKYKDEDLKRNKLLD